MFEPLENMIHDRHRKVEHNLEIFPLSEGETIVAAQQLAVGHWLRAVGCVLRIWHSEDENPFRKMFKDQKDIQPRDGWSLLDWLDGILGVSDIFDRQLAEGK